MHPWLEDIKSRLEVYDRNKGLFRKIFGDHLYIKRLRKFYNQYKHHQNLPFKAFYEFAHLPDKVIFFPSSLSLSAHKVLRYQFNCTPEAKIISILEEANLIHDATFSKIQRLSKREVAIFFSILKCHRLINAKKIDIDKVFEQIWYVGDEHIAKSIQNAFYYLSKIGLGEISSLDQLIFKYKPYNTLDALDLKTDNLCKMLDADMLPDFLDKLKYKSLLNKESATFLLEKLEYFKHIACTFKLLKLTKEKEFFELLKNASFLPIFNAVILETKTTDIIFIKELFGSNNPRLCEAILALGKHGIFVESDFENLFLLEKRKDLRLMIELVLHLRDSDLLTKDNYKKLISLDLKRTKITQILESLKTIDSLNQNNLDKMFDIFIHRKNIPCGFTIDFPESIEDDQLHSLKLMNTDFSHFLLGTLYEALYDENNPAYLADAANQFALVSENTIWKRPTDEHLYGYLHAKDKWYTVENTREREKILARYSHKSNKKEEFDFFRFHLVDGRKDFAFFKPISEFFSPVKSSGLITKIFSGWKNALHDNRNTTPAARKEFDEKFGLVAISQCINRQRF